MTTETKKNNNAIEKWNLLPTLLKEQVYSELAYITQQINEITKRATRLGLQDLASLQITGSNVFISAATYLGCKTTPDDSKHWNTFESKFREHVIERLMIIKSNFMHCHEQCLIFGLNHRANRYREIINALEIANDALIYSFIEEKESID